MVPCRLLPLSPNRLGRFLHIRRAALLLPSPGAPVQGACLLSGLFSDAVCRGLEPQLDLKLTCDWKTLLSFLSVPPLGLGCSESITNACVSLPHLTLLFVASSRGTMSSNTEMGALLSSC